MKPHFCPDTLLSRLREEKAARLKGGLYHQTQVALCYDSNSVEGSRPSEEQPRFIFETATVFPENDEHKAFYYRGLSQCPAVSDCLLETCRSAQDRYAERIRFFAGTAGS
jgi:hypothetical protein